jgi:tetratricopeptide (TPR) repeat protein
MGHPTESDFARITRTWNSEGPQSVEAELRRLHADSPESVRLTQMLMSCLWLTGRREEARSLLTEAAGRAPESADLLSSAAWMHYEEGDQQGAADAAERALDLQPEHPEAALILARAHVAQQRYRDALSVLGPALRSSATKRASRMVRLQAMIGRFAKSAGLVFGLVLVASALGGLVLLFTGRLVAGVALACVPAIALLVVGLVSRDRWLVRLGAIMTAGIVVVLGGLGLLFSALESVQ